jgi:O-antigen/teichoic acid export membrane protein
MRQRVLELGGDTVALGFFSLLCFLDIFIVKHYWLEDEAALYSRAAMVAKSFLYAATAINLVALPVVAAARAKGLDTRPLLLKFLLSMLAIEALGAVFVWRFTDLTIVLLCGNQPEFLKLAPLARWFCLAVIPLALYQLVLLYQLAVGSKGVLAWETLVIALYAVLLNRYHGTKEQVVACLGAAAILALLGGLWISLVRRPRGPGMLSPEESASMALQESVE